MLISIRLLLWFLAVLFAAGPVAAVIANAPSKFDKIFHINSYVGMERDLIVIAVAFLAIGLVDVLDCLASYLPKGADVSKAGLYCCIVMIIFLVAETFIYSIWSANPRFSVDDLRTIPFVLVVAFSSALASRLILLFGAA